MPRAKKLNFYSLPSPLAASRLFLPTCRIGLGRPLSPPGARADVRAPLKAQEDKEIWKGSLLKPSQKSTEFRGKNKSGQTFQTKYILIATGSRRRKLVIAGEAEFDGKGVVYCSTCDAPIFKNKTVAIVGGGNAGLEAVLDSLPYAAKIYLMEKDPALRGDSVTQEKIKKIQK